MGHYFDNRHEADRIDSTMAEYQKDVGTTVLWFPFLAESAGDAHPIYGESYAEGGADWGAPLRIPVMSAIPYEGVEARDDTGFYTTDKIHLVASAEQLRRHGLGDRLEQNREQLKDRFVYGNVVYDVGSIQTRGQINERDFAVGIDGTEVDPSELVNTEDFLQYAD